MINKITNFLNSLAEKIDSSANSVDHSVSKFKIKSEITAIEETIKLHRTEIDICNDKLISRDDFHEFIMKTLPEHRGERPDILLEIMKNKGIEFLNPDNVELSLLIIKLSISLDRISSKESELKKAQKAFSEFNNSHHNNDS